MKKILVYIDENDQSNTTIKLACTHAQKINAIIEIISVIDLTEAQHFLSMGNILKKEIEQKSQETIDRSVEAIKEWPDIKITQKIIEGNVADAIITSTANDSSISLIILGAPNKNSKNQYTLNTIISKIENILAVPILIVPSNLTNQQISELYNR